MAVGELNDTGIVGVVDGYDEVPVGCEVFDKGCVYCARSGEAVGEYDGWYISTRDYRRALVRVGFEP